MSQLQAILAYQECDKKLFKIEKEISSCPERKELHLVKKFLATAAEKLDALDNKAKQLKLQMVELAKKYKTAEETLSEFEHIDEIVGDGSGDIGFYKKKVLTLLDVLKKIKGDIANLTTAINETHDEYQKLKKQVIAKQAEYKTAQEKYEGVKASRSGEIEEIKKQLAGLKKEIAENVMERYENKRKEKVFPVVGKIQDRRCPYCSMELSLKDMNDISGGVAIECAECHRILYSE